MFTMINTRTLEFIFTGSSSASALTLQKRFFFAIHALGRRPRSLQATRGLSRWGKVRGRKETLTFLSFFSEICVLDKQHLLSLVQLLDSYTFDCPTCTLTRKFSALQYFVIQPKMKHYNDAMPVLLVLLECNSFTITGVVRPSYDLFSVPAVFAPSPCCRLSSYAS